jgi:hypothetical protein
MMNTLNIINFKIYKLIIIIINQVIKYFKEI